MRIGEVVKLTGLSEHTLRFYEKMGLLPNIAKKRGGIRDFCDNDLTALGVIECLKKTGMPLTDIKQFMQWCECGDETIQQRYEMFLERKKIVTQQIAELQKTMKMIEFKIKYYGDALQAGTLAIYEKNKPDAPNFFANTK